MKKTMIISISSISGGGKTSVINELKIRLPLSKAIYFDDYNFKDCPDDYFQWVQNGADYNAWNLDILANDINFLLSRANISYILLDYPFAYKNDKLAHYIDYAVFIDTPLDIAMARRIKRDLINKPSELLEEDLDSYLAGGRAAYLEMLKTIKPNSNFIIDGSLSIDNIVFQIVEQIKNWVDKC